MLAAQLTPRSGVRESFPHTKLAYFAQHAAETLDPGLTVLGALEEVAPAAWRPRLRSLLGNFLFSGDDVFKFCRVLSGGEEVVHVDHPVQCPVCKGARTKSGSSPRACGT